MWAYFRKKTVETTRRIGSSEQVLAWISSPLPVKCWSDYFKQIKMASFAAVTIPLLSNLNTRTAELRNKNF
jgi:hypothetical protein